MQKQDGLVKVLCNECDGEFIIGERAGKQAIDIENDLNCPFCSSFDVEPVASMPEDDDTNLELGCMGIYYEED